MNSYQNASHHSRCRSIFYPLQIINIWFFSQFRCWNFSLYGSQISNWYRHYNRQWMIFHEWRWDHHHFCGNFLVEKIFNIDATFIVIALDFHRNNYDRQWSLLFYGLILLIWYRKTESLIKSSSYLSLSYFKEGTDDVKLVILSWISDITAWFVSFASWIIGLSIWTWRQLQLILLSLLLSWLLSKWIFSIRSRFAVILMLTHDRDEFLFIFWDHHSYFLLCSHWNQYLWSSIWWSLYLHLHLFQTSDVTSRNASPLIICELMWYLWKSVMERRKERSVEARNRLDVDKSLWLLI